MARYKLKGTTTFFTTLMACAAFVVGAVKIWGVSMPKIWSTLLMILAMLLILMALAMVLVAVVNRVRRRIKNR